MSLHYPQRTTGNRAPGLRMDTSAPRNGLLDMQQGRRRPKPFMNLTTKLPSHSLIRQDGRTNSTAIHKVHAFNGTTKRYGNECPLKMISEVARHLEPDVFEQLNDLI